MYVSLFCFSACNYATRGTAKTAVLKADMPNTLKLSNGEVVYDLSGEWDIASQSSVGRLYSGLLEIKQDEDRFIGTLNQAEIVRRRVWKRLGGD